MSLLLDASAILAYLHDEPGAEVVDAALFNSGACLMSAANHAEVISRCLDRGVPPDVVEPMLAQLGYRVIEVTPADGAQAGLMRTLGRPRGLSLGDRLCLAAARRLALPVLTADRLWLDLAEPLGLDIRCIRPDAN
jgi:PIN domain nuclease of toxin-antitoxin system